MGSPEHARMRIGTQEREQAVKALGDHFSQGRLEPDEFEERMMAAYAARTVDDLDRLFDDLPRPVPPTRHPAVPQPPTAAYPIHQAPKRPPGTYDPEAPYGRNPVNGHPYSDRSKVAAGLLQLFLPCGLGRLYTGHIGIGLAQLLLTLFFGIGIIWAFIDGIVILAGRPTDRWGRPLRP